MGDVLQYVLETLDDVAVVRQLTHDVARTAGLTALEQTKLATVASEASRCSLMKAVPSEVFFSIETDPLPLLVVTIHASGVLQANAPAHRVTRPDSPHLDVGVLRGMVDQFEISPSAGGPLSVRVAMRLGAQAGASPEDLAHRLAELRPRVSAEVLERHNSELADALTLLEAQSTELEAANGALQQMNEQLAAVNETLLSTAASHRQLAEQQSALAELGRLAVATRDPLDVARSVATAVTQALHVAACAVFRLEADGRRASLVATEGCTFGSTDRFTMRRVPMRRLRATGVLVADPVSAASSFPAAPPESSRSGAMVAIPGDTEPWGVIVAFDPEQDRFRGTETVFLEAAASLLASSTARTATEDAANHAALHDALTGLPNRAEVIRRLDALLSPSSRSGRRSNDGLPPELVAVVFIDLDGFKEVNDTLGHAAGDLVLIETGTRLSAQKRHADTLGRLGGDEFVLIGEVADEQAAAALADRLLGAFAEPFLINDREVLLSGSAGVALADSSVGAGELLANADIAMYQAKRTPGPAVEAFRGEMRDKTESEAQLHRELRRALDAGDLRAVYQPLVDLADGTVRGVEALVRWNHADLGDVAAERLVAAAERIGLAPALTAWMIREAGGAVSTWNASHTDHAPLRLSVNFSPTLLDDPDSIARLGVDVVASGLPLQLLDIEITESAFANPTANILASIAELRRRGARLAVDDFGTGYSSLISLINFPFDVLKVDRSFVAPLDQGGNTVLVSAMTGIARGRGFGTVGEGIETPGQLAALIAAECDLGQGHLFVAPLEHEELERITELEPRFAETVRDARGAAFGELVRFPVTSGSAVPARILVVDDDAADLDLLCAMAGSLGHEMVPVSDPACFLATLQRVDPDIVLMDLRLRGTSGFDLVQQAGALLTMPVLAVTGYPDWVFENEPRSRLFASVISKPVDPEVLFMRIEHLLAARARKLTA